MKKWFTFPKITIVIITFAVCLALYSSLTLKKPVTSVGPSKQEVQLFVERTLPKIMENWDYEELEPLLYPGIMDNVSWKNGAISLNQMLGSCKMGNVQWKESKRKSHIKWSGVRDRAPVTFHSYMVDVKCKNPDVAALGVVVSDNLKYAGFHILQKK